MFVPPKLKHGDEVRVVAPSKSLGIIAQEQREFAQERFEKLGLKVTFASHVEEMDDFQSSSVKSRLADLHEAFADPQVKGIFTVIGGFNCNQLLAGLDYSLIRNNPKVFCGYSDTTALQNAILAKAGVVTYSGPAFSSFAMKKGFEYTLSYFKKCVMESEPFAIEEASTWSDDAWYLDQENRQFNPTKGWLSLSSGEAEGRIVGGNLCTLNLLLGTEYMPDLRNAILFLEDDYLSSPEIWDRNLQAVLHQPDFKEVRGVVIGRFQRGSQMRSEFLQKIHDTKPELHSIPVVANVDFGHTSPFITFPIGGVARLSVVGERAELHLVEH
ncbi:S66 family peptidase [Marininema halotolerans]|uniref:Muramoyltetrapeptide carboxypeptidase LdcA (Peptidoglycan recycling) n=1 Tax=Marininema halotolerans TaxID=1155944 RepID=A0A1I6U4Q7_9BACL|nr:S66 peptidase family protein [Marininema halotolerans]SFS96358.1 Muramoyltetrapeptide carboxypeptidase LdcA (peptidoglycan recycling) [Marininema halotolerans]